MWKTYVPSGKGVSFTFSSMEMLRALSDPESVDLHGSGENGAFYYGLVDYSGGETHRVEDAVFSKRAYYTAESEVRFAMHVGQGGVGPVSYRSYLNLSKLIQEITFSPFMSAWEIDTFLHATVFDMYVNAGGNAVKILQRLLNEFQENVTVDGSLGPKTIAAAQRVYQRAGHYLFNAYGIARRDYYFRLADRRTKSRKYARTRSGGKGGWIKRAEEFMDPRYQLSDAQFRERVSGWG